MIFHDNTLVEMVKKRPVKLADVRQRSDVGESKVNKYAFAFIKIIEEFVDGE